MFEWINQANKAVNKHKKKMEITAVELVIENEIKIGLGKDDVAKTYALALMSSYKTNWSKVNKMILDKWGPQGLIDIKNKAWEIKEKGQ